MVKAFSYIRMSSAEQQKGDSTRRQYEATQAYASKNGLELQDFILDAGVSAFRGQNADFGKLGAFIQAVEDGYVDAGSYLIVESLDRLSRQNMFEALGLLDRIIELGIVVVTLQDGQEYSRKSKNENSTNIMFAIVTMLRAHEESKIKSDRLSAVWHQKKLRAASGQPTGQRLPLWLKYSSDKSRIEVIEERVGLLQRIFEMARDGWGAYSICRTFNESRVSTWNPSTRHWQESYVKKLLSSRAVLGEYQPHRKSLHDGKWQRIPDGPVIPGYYPAVISHHLFDQAQQATRARASSGRGRKGKSLPNLFSGLLRCGNCGSGLRFLNKGTPPKGGKYLKCSAADLKGNCSTQALRYSVVEDALLTAIEDLDLELVLNGERQGKKKSEAQARLAELEQDLRLLSEKMRNLVEAIEIASGPIDSLTERLVTMEREKAGKIQRKRDVERDLEELGAIDPKAQMERLERLRRQLSDRSDSGDAETLRRALSAEIRRIVRRITIMQVLRIPHEYRIDGTLWSEAAGLTDHEIRTLCEKYPFEVTISYRNRDVQAFDPLTSERLRFRETSRLRLLRRKQELRRLSNGVESSKIDK